MDNIVLALQLTGYGLSGVFLALILLYIFIRVAGSIPGKKVKKVEDDIDKPDQ